MKNLFLSLAVVAALVTAVSSCKEKCTGSGSGSITVVAYPKHHGVSVRPYSVWVKFDSKESPGSWESNYDLVIAADTTENHIEVENLTCGDYYIYMTGFDTAIGDTVQGGIPYTVAEDASGEVSVDVPVTE